MSVQQAQGGAEAALDTGGQRRGPILGLAAGLLTHLRDPMRRSSYALIMGTALTSGLGLVFWALTARWLPPAAVGIGASLVTAMILLANLSTLGLRNGLVRFLPSAGRSSRRLILTSYALCAATAGAIAVIFLAGRGWWASKLDLLAGPVAGAAFVGATMVWVLFVLQDHVLVGMRITGWVPIANGLCSVAKIILLPVLAFAAGWAIFAASVLPAAVAVLCVTVIVLRHTRKLADEPGAKPVSVPRLIKFATTDHLTSLLWMAATNIVMLLVLQQAGPEASAYYFLATTIGYTLYLIISNVGSALVAEAARFPDRAVALARQALLNAARLVIPLAALGCLLAPLLLSLLGQSYADNATVLLRLILISAVPQLIIGISLSTARVRGDLRTIVIVYAAIAVGDLGGAWIGLQSAGLTGVGIACLVTEAVVALGLLLSGRTGLWSDQRGWRAIPSLILGLGSLRRQRRSRRQVRDLLAPALTACGVTSAPNAYRVLTSDCDTLVVLVDAHAEPMVIKIATSEAASAGLFRHGDMVGWLHDRPGTEATRALLPRILGTAAVAGERVLLESRLPGSAITDPTAARTAAAAAAIGQLHQTTSAKTIVDADLLREWVDEPLSQLRGVPALAGSQRALDRLAETLYEAFAGREVLAAVTHGDFWPGNVLSTDTEDGPAITGIVDWENARRVGLPDTDLVHWWLSAQPVELGAAVRTLLTTPEAGEAASAELPFPLANPHLRLEHVVLLTWLWHVSAGLGRASRNRPGPVWLTRNVKPIVRLFAQPVASAVGGAGS